MDLGRKKILLISSSFFLLCIKFTKSFVKKVNVFFEHDMEICNFIFTFIFPGKYWSTLANRKLPIHFI